MQPMHDNVIILPDGGPAFMKTLKLASLYAEKVKVFSAVEDSSMSIMAESYQSYIESHERKMIAIRKGIRGMQDKRRKKQMGKFLKKYLATQEGHEGLQEILKGVYTAPVEEFIKSNGENLNELKQLRDANILTSLIDDVFGQIAKNDPSVLMNLGEVMKGSSMGSVHTDDLPSIYHHPGNGAPATICTLLEFGIHFTLQVGRDYPEALQGMEVPDISVDGIRRASILAYFMLAATYAINNDCVGVTWDAQSRQFFDRCTESLPIANSEVNRIIARREAIKNRLGDLVLTSTIPDVSELPIENILELRDRRAAELEWFRVSLRKLAAGISPELEGEELIRAMLNAIDVEVQPALHELQASLDVTDSSAMRKLFTVKPEHIAGLISFSISSALGLPLDASAGLAGAGIAASKLFGFTEKELTKKEKLRSSPWSVLFHLQHATKK